MRLFTSKARRATAPTSQRSRPRSALRVEQLEDRWVPAVDVILEWNAVMLQADVVTHSSAPAEQPGPVLASRAFAMTSAAMYDAYNSIERIGQRYLISVPVSGNADSDAAVAQAAHIVLSALYPSQHASFDAALARTLQRIPDGASENRGRIVGAIVAGALLADRTNDGGNTFADIQNPPYVPNGRPGFHNVDPLHPAQGFYGPDGGDVDAFAVRDSEQFAPGHLGAQGVGSDRTDITAFLRTRDYEVAYDEVKRLGGDGVTTPTQRTPEQTVIGIYWGYDGRPGLGTPPRLYNQIARTIAVQEGNTEAENARMFALANIAMADAAMTAWEAKYDEEFWRPVLGIRGGGNDGNPDTRGDANWRPLGAPASNPAAPDNPASPSDTDFTPPFPAYTSGHATLGAAVFKTLERFYGRDDITFTFVSDEFNGITRDDDGTVRPRIARTFDSFSEASEENGQSRIYLGIHWAFDKTEGIRTGNQVANFVFNNFLRPQSGFGEFSAVSSSGGEGAGVEPSIATQITSEPAILLPPATTSGVPVVQSPDAPISSPESATPTAADSGGETQAVAETAPHAGGSASFTSETDTLALDPWSADPVTDWAVV
jgi:hypothetical protein